MIIEVRWVLAALPGELTRRVEFDVSDIMALEPPESYDYVQGWSALNRFRRERGLPYIPVPPFNAYLDEERLTALASAQWDVVEISNFASRYYALPAS
jgi:hypothetical protein